MSNSAFGCWYWVRYPISPNRVGRLDLGGKEVEVEALFVACACAKL